MAELTREEFGKVYERCFLYTQKFLIKRTSISRSQAEEIAQAAWTRAWEMEWQLREPNVLAEWVNGIAINIYKNCTRADAKYEALHCAESIFPGRQLIRMENTIDCNTLLERLDPMSRKIIVGYYLMGYTSEEVAGQIGITPISVRVRLLRIRRYVRDIFSVFRC